MNPRLLINVMALVGLLSLSFPSYAHLTSDFDFGIGYLNMGVEAGTQFSETLSTPAVLEFNYCINFLGPETAFLMSFTQALGSDFGALAFTRLGMGVRWYVTGINGRRTILDGQVAGRMWSPSPSVGLNFGLSNISFDTKTEIDQDFNASAIDAKLILGVEVPMTFNWMLTGQFNIISSVLGGSASSEAGTLSNEVGYTGFMMLIGLKATTL